MYWPPGGLSGGLCLAFFSDAAGGIGVDPRENSRRQDRRNREARRNAVRKRPMDLTGKTALITGGGTGLGKAVALLLGAEGMRTVISYSRSKEEADQTLRELTQMAVDTRALLADLRDEESPVKLVA